MTEDSEYTTENDLDPMRIESASQDTPATADEVLQLARGMLEQNRSEEALTLIEQYARRTSTGPVPVEVEPHAVFDAGVSDHELELAFESAESDREQMLDADEIAERAIRETDSDRGLEEIPDADEDFFSSGSSYATRTVATLLERQGDAPTASKIRAMVEDSGPSSGVAAEPSAADWGDPSPVGSNSPMRDRRTATIMELERWLVNLRGVAHQ